jgi:chromosome partitioning protein
MIWAFVNLKGGVGKSTLCVNLAAALVHARKHVLVLDLDPQASTTGWFGRRQSLPPQKRPLAFDVLPLPIPKSAEAIRQRAREADYALLDAPAFDARALAVALEAADLAVVPVEASQTSLDGTERTLKLISDKRFKIVLSRVQPGTRIGYDIYDRIHGQWRGHLVRYVICQRVEFANADLLGRSVLESEPAGQAAREVLAVARELRRAI